MCVRLNPLVSTAPTPQMLHMLMILILFFVFLFCNSLSLFVVVIPKQTTLEALMFLVSNNFQRFQRELDSITIESKERHKMSCTSSTQTRRNMEKEEFLQVSTNFWKKGGRTAVSSRGALRGIGTLWDDQKFDIVDIKHSPHWILTTLLQKDFNA